MKKTTRILMVLSIVFLTAIAAMADPPGPPTNNNSQPPFGGSGNGPVGAPLDGGLSLLLIGLGSAYGGKMLYKNVNRKKAGE
jgi:hypothetical protein